VSRWTFAGSTPAGCSCCLRQCFQRRTRGAQFFRADRLELVGERWTMLIIRDALLGMHRFDEFRTSLVAVHYAPESQGFFGSIVGRFKNLFS
jgi:hypothetical protein